MPIHTREEVEQRRKALSDLLKSQPDEGYTQTQLVCILLDLGFETTQATLSRDLAKLRAGKRRTPEGKLRWEIRSRRG